MNRRIVGISALVAMLMLGYLALNTFRDDQGAKADSASARAFSTAQRQAYEVLQGSTLPVPRPLQAHLRKARNDSVRTLWLNAAKYVPTGGGLWVANGSRDTCIIQARGAAVSCQPRAAALRKGVALGVVNLGPPPERKAREFIVYGIVPDSVKAVNMNVGGQRRVIRVRNNTYSLRAGVPILVKGFRRLQE